MNESVWFGWEKWNSIYKVNAVKVGISFSAYLAKRKWWMVDRLWSEALNWKVEDKDRVRNFEGESEWEEEEEEEQRKLRHNSGIWMSFNIYWLRTDHILVLIMKIHSVEKFNTFLLQIIILLPVAVCN